MRVRWRRGSHKPCFSHRYTHRLFTTGRLVTGPGSELSGYATLPEPELVFGDNKPDTHPLRGLIHSGPYSLRLKAPSRVRLALLTPRANMGKLRGLMDELEREASPREAKNYYPIYRGFQTIFRAPLV